MPKYKVIVDAGMKAAPTSIAGAASRLRMELRQNIWPSNGRPGITRSSTSSSP